MKRSVSFVLVLSVLIHLVGIYAFFIMRLSEIHTEMRAELARMPKECLSRIEVPRTEFQDQWIKEMEMRWNGRSYDIALIEPCGTSVMVYGIYDTAEDDLFTFIASIVETASRDDSPIPTSIDDFFDLEFEGEDRLIVDLPMVYSYKHNSPYLADISSLFKSDIAHPPRV